ncbi:MAG TPA: polysaccharide deacetylase family protein [Syntrophomonadaceae bacterium]|nr:polysaccharide deacetylase family protein [Syntrophomonadaceae bacterium]
MQGLSLSITVDLEDWYHIPSVCGSPFSVYDGVDDFFSRWRHRYDYLSEPTARVLDLLDEFGVTATFFIVADLLNHYPDLVERVVERGHEIACHGLDHSCKIHPGTREPLISCSEFEERTLLAKEMLEGVSGEEVIGYRAPNVLVAGWMLDSLEEIGFKYDSSVCVNSLYNKTDSNLQGVFSHPYHPKGSLLEPGEGRSFVEFPWSYLDVFGFKIPSSGGPMLRFLGSSIIAMGLQQSMSRGHTVFYFHPLDISLEHFPKVGRGRPFYWAVKGKVVEKRIGTILRKFQHVRKITLKEAYLESKGQLVIDG